MKKTIFSVMFAIALTTVMGSCAGFTKGGSAVDSLAVDSVEVVDTVACDSAAVLDTLCCE